MSDHILDQAGLQLLKWDEFGDGGYLLAGAEDPGCLPIRIDFRSTGVAYPGDTGFWLDVVAKLFILGNQCILR